MLVVNQLRRGLPDGKLLSFLVQKKETKEKDTLRRFFPPVAAPDSGRLRNSAW
jgi:hypothetical protein